MSGLALVFHLDDRPATTADVVPMLAEMARRGPDGEDTLVSGPVALGHRHLRTTPEALIEPMPFSDLATGCCLTGDIRLDNRSELLTAFGLTREGRVVGDGELVLRAWDRWGEDCATHFLGDFAFAIWDPKRRIVFAARDQMGMRQLIYAHREGRLFACATSARAVALAPEMKPALNDLRLAEALIDFEWGSLTSTFFEGVLRLPPGHCLAAGQKRLSVRAYWTMIPPAALHLNSDGDYADALREVLSEAVRARLRGAGPVGSMLSGGMDSGSVVALACRMTSSPLPTFSGVGPDAQSCVETAAIHAALTMPNLAPTLIVHDGLGPWKDDLLAAWMALEEPWDFHMTQPRTAYLAARRAGVKVVLDGGGGDVTLSHGSQLVRNLRAGRVIQVLSDARGLSTFYGEGKLVATRELITAFLSAFTPDVLRRLRAAWRDLRPPSFPEDGVIDTTYARNSGVLKVLRDWNRGNSVRQRSFAEERIWAWHRSGIHVARERYDRVAAYFGIEPRDPFMDRRVSEFCLSLPMDQFQQGGWPKIILRRAMEGMLPDAVRWRRGKQHLGSTFTERLLAQWPNWEAVIREAQPALTGRVRAELFANSSLKEEKPSGLSPSMNLLLSNALFLNNGI